MRTIKILGLLGLTAAFVGFAFSSCTKVEEKLKDPTYRYHKGDSVIVITPGVQPNFAYLSEPSAFDGVAYEKVMAHTATEVDVKFEIRFVDYTIEPLVVNMSVDNAVLVGEYNARMNTSFVPIPQDKLLFPGENVSVNGTTVKITVPANVNYAEVTIKVQKFPEMVVGEEYAVTAKITSIESSVGINLPAPGAWAGLLVPITLLKEFMDETDLPGTPIPAGKFANFYLINDDKNFTLQARDWEALFADDITLECWGRSTGWGSNGSNMQLFDNRKMNGNFHATADEVFMRFGNKVASAKSTFEIKAFGGSGSDAFTPDWPSNEWFHIAVVYKKRDNTLTIYRNGERNQKLDGYPEPSLHPTKKLLIQHIGMMATHSGSKVMAIREFRIWKSARRPAQIKNFMRLMVDPNEPHLVGYWPFDKATGNGDSPTAFSSIATFAGNSDIPKAPAIKVYSSYSTESFNGAWSSADVDFSTVQVTLADGTKNPQ